MKLTVMSLCYYLSCMTTELADKLPTRCHPYSLLTQHCEFIDRVTAGMTEATATLISVPFESFPMDGPANGANQSCAAYNLLSLELLEVEFIFFESLSIQEPDFLSQISLLFRPIHNTNCAMLWIIRNHRTDRTLPKIPQR